MVVPAQATPVFAVAAGRLDFILDRGDEVQPGDVVALTEKSRELAAFLGPLENARPAAHLSLDKDKRSVRVNEIPEREQIPVICEISLVVENYSR